MPAVSKQQRKFMGLVHAVQKGKVPASKVSKSARDAAKQMKKKDVEDFASTDEKGLPKKKQKEAVSVNEAGGVVTARIQQKPKGYWAVFNSRGQSQFEGNKKFMINILKKASTLSPNAIGSILDRARFGDKHLKFKAQFSRYYFNEAVNEKVARPMSYRLRKAQDEIEYMITQGPLEDEGVYDKPGQAMKLLQIAQKSLGKIK